MRALTLAWCAVYEAHEVIFEFMHRAFQLTHRTFQRGDLIDEEFHLPREGLRCDGLLAHCCTSNARAVVRRRLIGPRLPRLSLDWTSDPKFQEHQCDQHPNTNAY